MESPDRLKRIINNSEDDYKIKNPKLVDFNDNGMRILNFVKF